MICRVEDEAETRKFVDEVESKTELRRETLESQTKEFVKYNYNTLSY